MYSDILFYVKTVQDQEEFEKNLAALKDSLYRKEGEFEKVLETEVRADLAREIKKIIAKEQIDKRLLIENLERQLKKLRKLALTLSFYPSESSLDRISNWIYKNISKDILLDININRFLLGGAVIEFEGKYFDGSLKKKLEEYFINFKNEGF